jgi:hypothetical protein
MAPSHTQGLAQIASMLRLFHVKVTVPADVCAGNDKLACFIAPQVPERARHFDHLAKVRSVASRLQT